MRRILSVVTWILVGCLGAGIFGWIALNRGEKINAAWLVIAAVSFYAVAYRFYSKLIASNIFALDANRAHARRATQ